MGGIENGHYKLLIILPSLLKSIPLQSYGFNSSLKNKTSVNGALWHGRIVHPYQQVLAHVLKVINLISRKKYLS